MTEREREIETCIEWNASLSPDDGRYLLAQLREAWAENRALKRRMGKAGWETALLLRRAEGKLEAVEELAERIRLCAAEAGSPKQAALLTVLLELDRILHPQEAE